MPLHFTVEQSNAGIRLEPFLYQKLGERSHKQIKQAIDRNKVTVNGRPVHLRTWILKEGDHIEVLSKEKTEETGSSGGKYHFVQVIFEDDALLVANKPPFVDYDSFVSHVNDYLRRIHSRKEESRPFYPYLGQMHRLDKETSGIMVFTKKKSANVLSDQFRGREIRKFYLAVVLGRVSKDHGILESRIEKGMFGEGKKARVVDGEEGKESKTEYWVEERYDEATLLRLLIHTGRTHQIRVHMAEVGHPVVGDKLYGGRSRKIFSAINRQALHAHRIEFRHPITHKSLNLTAPLPEDLTQLIDRLRTGNCGVFE